MFSGLPVTYDLGLSIEEDFKWLKEAKVPFQEDGDITSYLRDGVRLYGVQVEPLWWSS